MRSIIVRAAVLAMLCAGASLAFAYSTGPPWSETGARAVATRPAETNCTLCHAPSGSQNSDPNGSIQLVGIPAQYSPGSVYPIEVHLNYDWSQNPSSYPVRWGFQITAVAARSGDSAGTWVTPNVPPDSLQIKRYSPASSSAWKRRIYLEHTFYDIHQGENEDGQSGPIVWHFSWVAPPADSGRVYFFCAGNAANGDGDHVVGDHIYTTSDSSDGQLLLAVQPPRPGAFITALETPYPNPMTVCTKIDFQVERAGEVDLAVFDLQGRKVRTLVHERLEPNEYGNFWDGRNDANVQMKNGVYFIRLTSPGLAKPLSRRVTLAR
jgi:hypothetical protein